MTSDKIAAAMVNVFDSGCEYDPDDPDGYRSGVAHVGREAGGSANTVKLFETPPGQSICPYHYEYEEEWLLVLEGSLVVRTPDGEQPLERGDIVCFPAGPLGAHKVMNCSDAPARMMMFSNARVPAVSVYPDSDKIGVWPSGDEADDLVFKRSTAVPWSEGEDGWDHAV
jgi:uncharacterized cupin superfamily protein